MIRKLSALVVAGLLVACAHAPASAPAAQGKPYTSPLGFSMNMIGNWVVLNKAGLQEELTKLDAQPGPPERKNSIAMVRQKIEGGLMEMFLGADQNGAVLTSKINNITVMKVLGQLPGNDTEVAELCQQLPGIVSKQVGREITFHHCGLEKVAGLNVMHMISTGQGYDSTTVQYMFQKSANTLLLFTGTFGGDDLPALQSEFEAMMQSVKMNQ